MAQFQASDPNVEISGDALLAFANAMGPFKSIALKRLINCGVVNIEPGKWYSLQPCLDAFRELPQKIGRNTVFLIGKIFFNFVSIPEYIDSIDEALMAVDDIYQVNYRNGDAGCYKFRLTGEREGRIFCSSPYPCAFDQGLVIAICNHFKPSNSSTLMVTHCSETGCRSEGSNACTYTIKW